MPLTKLLVPEDTCIPLCVDPSHRNSTVEFFYGGLYSTGNYSTTFYSTIFVYGDELRVDTSCSG